MGAGRLLGSTCSSAVGVLDHLVACSKNGYAHCGDWRRFGVGGPSASCPPSSSCGRARCLPRAQRPLRGPGQRHGRPFGVARRRVGDACLCSTGTPSSRTSRISPSSKHSPWPHLVARHRGTVLLVWPPCCLAFLRRRGHGARSGWVVAVVAALASAALMAVLFVRGSTRIASTTAPNARL